MYGYVHFHVAHKYVHVQHIFFPSFIEMRWKYFEVRFFASANLSDEKPWWTREQERISTKIETKVPFLRTFYVISNVFFQNFARSSIFFQICEVRQFCLIWVQRPKLQSSERLYKEHNVFRRGTTGQLDKLWIRNNFPNSSSMSRSTVTSTRRSNNA